MLRLTSGGTESVKNIISDFDIKKARDKFKQPVTSKEKEIQRQQKIRQEDKAMELERETKLKLELAEKERKQIEERSAIMEGVKILQKSSEQIARQNVQRSKDTEVKKRSDTKRPRRYSRAC